MFATLTTLMWCLRPLVKVHSDRPVNSYVVRHHLGFLRPITRRLDETERATLIQSGAVFVWVEEEHAAGLKRWTDGRVWSQSRMREPYLFYDEKLGDGSDSPDQNFQTYRFVDASNMSRGGFSSSAVSHRERSTNVHRGLVKQAYSALVMVHPNTRPQKFHIVANGMVRDIFDSSSIARLIGGMGSAVLCQFALWDCLRSCSYDNCFSLVNADKTFRTGTLSTPVRSCNTWTLLHTDILTHHPTPSCFSTFFANNLQQTGKFRINEEDIFTALGGMMQQVKGAYACVAMLAGFGIMAFRDPNGIRPVGMAVRKAGTGNDYLFSSESVVADAGGFGEWQDVRPGEAVIITRAGVSRRQVAPPATFAPDIFEYVYFARPDSVLDGISVYRSRMAMGDALADEVQRVLAENNLTVDVVIPVPDTSRVAALNLAQKLQLPYREGFIKNRYVGRTFIMPGQEMRKKNVRRKLNAMALEFVDKNVLLVDDSIVRGTTSKEIVQMAKDVGAKKVIVASCAPPIRFSNVYGIDMPSRSELVAHGRDTSSIASAIGADLVIFQTLPDLIESVRQFNPAINNFDCSVFTGDYVTGDVDEKYLSHLESLRADNVRGKTMGTAVAPQSTAHDRSKEINGTKPNGVLNERGSDVTLGSDILPTVNGSDDTVGLHNSWNTS
ncbi:hypothetical protein MSAN_01026000 [Mycena sanguinolenta]|uniref:Phosphoribosyltransferase domain-containing protein n=1 Tax=Mycena sanguinolenta TaxID=230812 RepID=A0A8H7D640_9AGAR|nr:hypothetical protein MSAN_01026000 [Mycena sanguinolenta]